MFENEKPSVFGVGFLILGLAVAYLCLLTWSRIVLFHDWELYTFLKLNMPRIAGAVIFHLIGLYMIRSGVKKRGPGKGKKGTVFWVGLLTLGVASMGLFDVIWKEVVVYKIYLIAPISLPTITRAIIFILIGLYMMKSEKGERTTVFWVGLIILGLVSTFLFDRIWNETISNDKTLVLKRNFREGHTGLDTYEDEKLNLAGIGTPKNRRIEMAHFSTFFFYIEDKRIVLRLQVSPPHASF